ncbi:hypothetical protein ACPZJU_19190, partial [Cereibacter johrii]
MTILRAHSREGSANERQAGSNDINGEDHRLRRTAHGLRKYRMNVLAEHGASVLVMQSWVGHTTLLEVQESTRRADRRRVISEAHPVKRDPAGA